MSEVRSMSGGAELAARNARHIGAPERAAREFKPNEFWNYHAPSGRIVEVT
jgi:hypothetical protein